MTTPFVHVKLGFVCFDIPRNMQKLLFVVLLGYFVGGCFFSVTVLSFLLLSWGDGPDTEFSPFPVWDKLHKIGVESKPKAKKFPNCSNKCLKR